LSSNKDSIPLISLLFCIVREAKITMASIPVKVAILDDYQSVAVEEFRSHLGHDFSSLRISLFSDTLAPYSHAQTSDAMRAELVERLKPFTIISTMRERTPFPAPLLRLLPNLKLLVTTGSVNAAIDSKAAKELGIVVAGTSWGGAYNTGLAAKPAGPESTTQHAWALILGIARGIASDDAEVKSGGWQTSFTVGLSGKTLGILGAGKLGTAVARIAKLAFGMEVIAWSSSLTQEAADQKALESGLPAEDEQGNKTFRAVSKEELFEKADVLSVHYVLSDRSRGIVGAADLAHLKPSALLVNTSRGPLIDQDALLEVLKAGKIRGAALDVFELEPLPRDSEWRTTTWGKNGTSQVLLSPHMGYVEEQTIRTWYVETAENIRRWLHEEDLHYRYN
jgi:lactate dehydrogenase-like 2-hydroxyacid dehydrogenase